MKLLKNFIYISVVFLLVYSCGSSSIKKKTIAKEKPVRIANDSLEYEIIIIDPGFNMFLASVAQPVGFTIKIIWRQEIMLGLLVGINVI